jgi:hypothetical protein
MVKIMNMKEMRTLRSIFAVLAVIVCTVCAARTQEIVCPDTISVEQKLSQPVEGWKGSVETGISRFSNVMFYDGPLEQKASLVPDKQWRKGDKEYASWELGPISEPNREIWISCQYTGTFAVLSRPLPRNVTECTVTYNPRQGTSDPGYVERVTCKVAVPPKTGAPKTTP